MLNTMEIKKIIFDFCAKTMNAPDLKEDEDFFDRGASSLTILELQLQVEHALALRASTSELMSRPTLDGWCQIYRDAEAQALDAPRSMDAS